MTALARLRPLQPTQRTVAVVVVITLVAAYFRVYRLTEPGYLYGLIGYDDGVYFGASVDLVHGVMPYRDFVLVHPPLLPLILTPFALLSKTIGTAKAFGYARLLSVIVGTAAVPLLAVLLRHRGTLAVAVGCALLAVHTDSVISAHSTFLEPYLVLFCLCGLIAVFDGDRFTDQPRRQLGGGVLLGLACAVKIFALAPIVVLLCASLRSGRRTLRILAGVLVGFAVPSLPFAVLAPKEFGRDVFYSQITRTATRTVNEFRLKSMLGITDLPGVTDAELYVITAAVLLVAVAGYLLAWRSAHRRPTPLEVFAIGTGAVIAGMFFASTEYFWHYAGFFAPFGALAFALPTSSLLKHRSWAIGWSVLAAALVATLVLSSVHEVEPAPGRRVPLAAIHAVVPAGACVVSDTSALLLVSNRFPTAANCPHVVDGLGMDIVYGQGEKTRFAEDTRGPRHRWFAAVDRAKYLLLDGKWLQLTPWRHGLRRYVYAHFRRVSTPVRQVLLFVRKRPTSAHP